MLSVVEVWRSDFFFEIESMQIKIFNIPITDNGLFLQEINKFLAGNKVLEIEQHFYKNENGAYWSFCVRYISGIPTGTMFSANKKKIDYKEELEGNIFSIFSKLRECRKIIAANDAVPAYAVFTDKELVEIAKLPILEASKLVAIKGIGDKKTEKYGKVLLEEYHKIQNNETHK